MKKEREDEKQPVGKGGDMGQPHVQDSRSQKQREQEDKARLQAQVRKVQEHIAVYKMQQVMLQQQAKKIEEATNRFSKEYVEMVEEYSRKANLHVAVYRLQQARDRDEVVGIIQEILINLVGTEEIGIFELNPEKSLLFLVGSLGINAETFHSIALGSGIIGRTAVTGEPYFNGEHSHDNDTAASREESDLTACVPLKLDGKVTGAIAVFRLLPQKPALKELDLQLFDVLAGQAATSLYSTRSHSNTAGVAG